MRALAFAATLSVAMTMSAFAADPAMMVDTKMGKVMATPQGMTLYTLDKDAEGKSTCDADCLKNWPAFLAEAGAMAEGKWSIVKTTDGKDMWAYEGKPLYTFVKDAVSGETMGDGVGGVWHIVK